MPESENNENSEPTIRSRAPGDGRNDTNTSATTAGGEQSPPARGWDAVIARVESHKLEALLAVVRALTVLCTLSYLIGFPGPSSYRFKQALLLSAATSSLRLHQRMPPPPLNQLRRSYFMNLIREDSFHYLIFPFMFFTGQPITLALLPCALYALFNSAVYAINILDLMGNQEPLKLKISNLAAKYQQNLLYIIALSEVALMPIVVVSVFTRVVGILVPIFYYRFLLLRYNSSRNAHLRLLVHEIKTFATANLARIRQR